MTQPDNTRRVPGDADAVHITPDRLEATVQGPEGPTTISRIQDPEHRLTGYWARTSRTGPTSAIQPLVPTDGIVPAGEVELIDLLADPDVVVADSRTPDWFDDGTIPGAVSLPFKELPDRLDALDCRPNGDGSWDCSTARRVAVFCNGPWCGQSPTAIRRMLEAGYPAERIHYYRNGIQGWRMLGLSVTASDPTE